MGCVDRYGSINVFKASDTWRNATRRGPSDPTLGSGVVADNRQGAARRVEAHVTRIQSFRAVCI